MKRIISLFLMVCLVVSLFAGCCLKHKYELFTCVKEEDAIYRVDICAKCGEEVKSEVEDLEALAVEILSGNWYSEKQEEPVIIINEDGTGSFNGLFGEGVTNAVTWRYMFESVFFTGPDLALDYGYTADGMPELIFTVRADPEEGFYLNLLVVPISFKKG